MTEFPVDVLGIIKTMFLRSLGNPNALKYTINNLLDIYRFVIFLIFIGVVARFLLRFYYKILKRIKENKKDKNNFIKFLYKILIDDLKKDKNSFIKILNKKLSFKKYWKNEMKFIKIKKKDIKEIFEEEKHTFKLLKYPLIGSVLVGTSRAQVSLCFWLFGRYHIDSTITKEPRPFEEGRVLGLRSTYTLSIFIIAGCFIGLSFGNKMLRNIGILFYVLGIFFAIFGLFLDYGYISDGLGNLVI